MSQRWNMLQCSFTVHDLCTFTHIAFSVNKPNSHLQGWGMIFSDSSNKINVSTLQFSIVNFQTEN